MDRCRLLGTTDLGVTVTIEPSVDRERWMKRKPDCAREDQPLLRIDHAGVEEDAHFVPRPRAESENTRAAVGSGGRITHDTQGALPETAFGIAPSEQKTIDVTLCAAAPLPYQPRQ